jgi:hypothetical protein
MPATDRPSASSLRRYSEERAAQQRAAGRETAEKNAEEALRAALDACPAARLEERTHALYEVLEAELEVLERRNIRNRPSMPAMPGDAVDDLLPPMAVDKDYWLLRLTPEPSRQRIRSPAPELCVQAADWLYLATCLWEAADDNRSDPNSIPPLRRHLGVQLRDKLGKQPPKTMEDAYRCLEAVNDYIANGTAFPTLAEVEATLEVDPLLPALLGTRPAHEPQPPKRGSRPARQTIDDEPQHIRRLVVEAALGGRVFPAHDRRLIEVTQHIHQRRLTALCFSGGGIRSATFGLGVLQAITEHGFLSRFDYLSTVSGGGYIGSWLSAWIRHEGRDAVEQKLREPPVDPTDAEPAPVAHLRAYSNYLSPRVGFFSADTWTLIATYLRNLLLMWLILIPLLSAAVMVPRIALAVTRMSALSGWQWLVLLPVALVGLGLGAMAVKFVHGNRPERDQHGALASIAPASKRDQGAFIRQCLVPFVVSTTLLTSVWAWFYRSEPSARQLSWDFAGLFALAGAMVHWTGWMFARRRESSKTEGATLFLTGAASGAIAYVVTSILPAVDGTRQDAELYTTLASPILLLVVMLMNQLYVGFISRDPRKADDAEREWAARFNAWILIAALGWALWSALVLIAPLFISNIPWSSLLATTGVTGWLTAHLGSNSQTGPRAAGAKGVEKLKSVASAVGLGLAAPLFVVSFVLLISWLDALAIAKLSVWPEGVEHLTVIQLARSGSLGITLGLAIVFLGASNLIARRIDSNKFSLHAMYRMRLIRAYLGASRRPRERVPDPFTGFDENDNMPMSDLRPSEKPDRPLHIVNVALNLASSARLSWQERKAESFTISPLHAGSAQLGYRRTAPGPAQLRLNAEIERVRDCDKAVRTRSTGKCLADAEVLAPRIYGGFTGISLGTAITISGAAASPNMGYHSSPAITFLMTLFNARLGWWLGNPGPSGEETFHLASPTDPVQPIVDELFGHTDDRRPYVYLSDGGHFENLALYEMVRRRCRFILVSDAGCDPTCSLEDVGNAIRKIRVDLGVPIEFEPGAFDIKARSKDGEEISGEYWAVGRIGYSAIDAPRDMPENEKRKSYDGVLIYVKPCFYGREPRDVFNYALGHPEFPHEPTSDQWFSESQFESYRSLGEHIGHELFKSERVLDLLRGVYPETRQREPEGQVEGPRINTTVTATGTITTITT